MRSFSVAAFMLKLVSVCLLTCVAGTASPSSDFVGASACAQCHEAEYQAWKGSHHDWAMRPATAENVLGNFNDARFKHYGLTSSFYQRDGKFYIKTDNADGKLQEFEIAYTFGFYPLQQYLIAFPDGRYQALSVSWDSRPESEGGQRWFHLYPDEAIPSDDILHWTGPYQNWNSRCAECHSTNLQKNYDAATDRYQTRWDEINVACEACHGSGRRHLDWTQGDDEVRKKQVNKGLQENINAVGQWLHAEGKATAIREQGKAKTDQLSVCGSCHSRRALIDDLNKPGDFHNQHRLQLLDEPLYHADGQVLDEVYVLGSFLQSKMYHRGVVCSNCHEPHSLKLRAEGNGVCAQCHSTAVFDTPAHHHHPQGAGSQCVNCHMPETTYMVVDPRRDHSLRIPRPDLSDKLGAPNACIQCHTERTNGWAADALTQWLAESGKRLPKHSGEILHPARAGKAEAQSALLKLAMAVTEPAIVRATALSLLQNYPSREAVLVAQTKLVDPDPLVRVGAVRALEILPSEQRLVDLLPLLNDPAKNVRLEVARLLSDAPVSGLSSQQQTQLKQGLEEYRASILLHADTPNGQLNLGVYYAARENFPAAEKAYRHAMVLDARHVPARLNMADLYRQQGKDKQGETLLKEAIDMAPDSAAPRHALGLLLVRQKRYREATDALRRAARLAPENIRYGYIYAVALNSVGKADDALVELEALHKRQVQNQEVLFALLDIHQRQQNWQQALEYTEILLGLLPGNRQLKQLQTLLQQKVQ